jgi:hypothetical protein
MTPVSDTVKWLWSAVALDRAKSSATITGSPSIVSELASKGWASSVAFGPANSR